MLSWFHNKKKEKLFQHDLNECLSIHGKKEAVTAKIEEIEASQLDDEQKTSLIEILTKQLDIIDADVRAYGLSMTHHFTGQDTITRMVPIGVDMSEFTSYKVDIPKTHRAFEIHEYLTYPVRLAVENTELTSNLANTLYEKVTKDERSSDKRIAISKIPFSENVKKKLTKLHTQNDKMRKREILKAVSKLTAEEGTKEARELSILSDVVSTFIDNSESPDIVVSTGRTLAGIENSLVFNDIYKRFIHEDEIIEHFKDIHKIGHFYDKIAYKYLGSLEETGHFVTVEGVTRPYNPTEDDTIHHPEAFI